METIVKNELALIDFKEFGIEESKANLILAKFEPLQVKMAELEEEYKQVLALPQEDPMTELKAKELGKKYMKIRTSRAAIHKEEKAFFLNAGRYVDRIKNDADKSTIEHEDELEKIEKFHANLESERIKTLANSRVEKLKEFEFDGSQLNLGTMDDNVWISFLSGTEMSFKAKKEEEKRIAQEKIEAENAAIRERARIEEENRALKIAAELKEKELEEERKKQAEILAKQKAESEAKEKAAEAIRAAEQEAADKLLEAQRKQAAKEKASADEKLKLEREANAKLQAELVAKQEAEKKVEAIKQAEIKAKEAEAKRLAKAPDKIKLLQLASQIDGYPMLQLSSEEAKQIMVDVSVLYGKISAFIREKSNTL